MAPANKTSTRKAVSGHGRDRLSATLALDAPIVSLSAVGPKRAQAFGDLGIVTIRDLLANYPRRYVDMSQVVSCAEAPIGHQVTVVGQIRDVKSKRPRPKLTLVEIAIVDETGTLLVTCFNQPWLAGKLAPGMRVSASGKVEFNYGFKRMVNPYLEPLEPEEEASGLIVPIHPTNARIGRKMMQRVVGEALEAVRGCHDPLPVALRLRYRLCSRFEALRAMHEPTNMAQVAMARRRLIYEELLMVELGLMGRAARRMEGVAPFAHTVDGSGVRALPSLLPFRLSPEQQTAVADILAEMEREAPMNHLLLGDVGTGKTIVALFALVAAVDSGNQACMMGPTEVLVRQYGNALGGYLDELGITWAVLTGFTTAEERARIIEEAATGQLKVLFGTHALLEPDVSFERLSCVVIDEQQRFGVEQRATLVGKGKGCDVLSCTATPIPRSLALALYGDLTLSYLHVRPAATAPRTTKVCHFQEEGIAYDAIREALERGEQAYIICPLIGIETASLDGPAEPDVEDEAEAPAEVEYAYVEWGLESGEFDDAGAVTKAATTHAKVLSESIFPNARVGLLHGKLSSAEKVQIMQDFSEGHIDILVSTTVVEVGVDVPNATVMVIEDADRFGLAQLHQLRGRVGRGQKPGQVFLVSRSLAPNALERLSSLERIDDGFELSEQDLSMRREGDVFGGRQHGKSPLKLVNVVRDAKVVEAAQADARAIQEGTLVSDDERSIILREAERLELER